MQALAQAKAAYAERLAEADRIRDTAKADYLAALRAARDAGVKPAQIARELGVTRQRVAALLSE